MCWCVCKSARILDRGCMYVKALWTPSFTIIRYSTEKSGALHMYVEIEIQLLCFPYTAIV